MRILVIMQGYFPGEKYGGPPISIDNLCINLKKHEWFIITRDHDLHETKRYEDISLGWNAFYNGDDIKCRVRYFSDRKYNYRNFRKIINEVHPDLVYLQSVFESSVLPVLCIAKRTRQKVLLAPRGELNSAALTSKRLKKWPYLRLLSKMRLFNNIFFQSTSNEETEAIISRLDIPRANIFELENVTSEQNSSAYLQRNFKKRGGTARFIYFSRILPHKNLLYAINCLTRVSGSIEFDVYGPIEDKRYWRECEKRIADLPSNITVKYCNRLAHADVKKIFPKYDALLLPTKGENYGHVIVESLSCGCPVIISDKTPWSDIEEYGAGFVIPLNEHRKYTKAIQKIVDMDSQDIEYLRLNIRNYNKIRFDTSELISKYDLAFREIKSR